jgi:hypothetical protein
VIFPPETFATFIFPYGFGVLLIALAPATPNAPTPATKTFAVPSGLILHLVGLNEIVSSSKGEML